MTAGATSYAGLDAAVSEYSQRTDAVRQSLYYCIVTFLRRATRELRADVHASSYVHTAAALEQLVGNVLTAVVNEINV